MKSHDSERPPSDTGISNAIERMVAECSQFEQQLRAGESPHIEDCLAKFEPVYHPQLLERLLEFDLKFSPRWKSGQVRDEADYRPRFPQLTDVVAKVFRKLQADPAAFLHDVSSEPSDPTTGSPAPAILPPELLESFSVGEEVGAGRFGTVYVAYDKERDCRVAIKLLNQEWLGDDALREKFLEEGRIMARLGPRKFVAVHRVLDFKDRGCALVMEYLPGGNLRDFGKSWRKGLVKLDDLLAVMEQVAQAVYYIHTVSHAKASLVHRDLKPENILLDKDNYPFIIDFGFAALTSSLVNAGETAAGTRGYMSPEQARHFDKQKAAPDYQKQPAAVDSRSDIGSLGVILYEMLTGELPSDGCRSDDPDATCVAPKELNHDILPKLDEIVRKCLSKNPDDRYQTAEELAKALHDCRTVRFSKRLYLSRVLENKTFRDWSKRAVVLDTIEDLPDDPFLEQTLSEIPPDVDQDVEGEDDDDAADNPRPPRRGSIAELAKDIRHMVLIGESGAGKSTTLQHYCHHTASNILQDPTTTDQCPIYLELRLCCTRVSLLDLLAEKLDIPIAELEDRLRRGEFVLLLDGLNEVEESYQPAMDRDLLHLLDRFPEVGVILTSRPGRYRRQLPLPVFRLQRLADEQMEHFLERNCSTPEEGRTLASTLRRHPKLWGCGHNPMMLFMFACVGTKRGGQLPANRAQLIRQFMTWIFDREAQKFPQTDSLTKERLLGEVGFATRMSGKVAFSRDEFLLCVKQQGGAFGFQIDSREFLQEVLDNNLLEATGDTLAFVHELYQEYFAATALKRRYEGDPGIVVALVTQENWEEPLTLLYGLLEPNSRRALFSLMVEHNLRVAARCLASEDEAAQEAVAEFETAINMIDLRTAERDRRRLTLDALCIVGNARLFAEKLKVCQRRGLCGDILNAISHCEDAASLVVESVRSELKDHFTSCKRVGSILTIGWGHLLVISKDMKNELLQDLLRCIDAKLGGELSFALCSVFQLQDLMSAEDLVRLIQVYLRGTPGNSSVAIEKLKRVGVGAAMRLSHSDVMNMLITTGQFEHACRWVVAFGLTDSYSLEEIVRQSLKAGSYRAALECIRFGKLTDAFSPRELIGEMLAAGRYKEAMAWVTHYGLRAEFSRSRLVRQMAKAGQYRAAFSAAKDAYLAKRSFLEGLVRRMIGEGQIDEAMNSVKECGLVNRFILVRLVSKMVRKGQYRVAAKWVERFRLTNKSFLRSLVCRMIVHRVEHAAFWVEKFDLGDEHSLVCLGHRLMDAGQYGHAASWIEKYGLTNTPVAERLVEKLIDDGQYKKAATWVGRYDLVDKFPAEALVHRMIEARQYSNAARWVRMCGLTNKFPAEDLVRRMIEAGQSRKAAIWAKRFRVTGKFPPGSFGKPKE